MANKQNNIILSELFGILEICGLLIVLSLALFFQFALKELPCPLCLLQRVGFLGVMLAMCMNLQFGYKNSHIGLSLLFALFTGFVSLRQVALHVIPGTGSYGYAFLGYHLYTWSFIATMAIIMYYAVILIFDFKPTHQNLLSSAWKTINKSVIFLVSAIILINMVATYMECGLGFCPENPTKYSKE